MHIKLVCNDYSETYIGSRFFLLLGPVWFHIRIKRFNGFKGVNLVVNVSLTLRIGPLDIADLSLMTREIRDITLPRKTGQRAIATLTIIQIERASLPLLWKLPREWFRLQTPYGRRLLVFYRTKLLERRYLVQPPNIDVLRTQILSPEGPLESWRRKTTSVYIFL